MSHHLDSPLARADVRLDITDLYVFAGQSGTVFVMNVCTSLAGDIPTPGFHPEALYEFKIDIDDDAVEDLTLRFRFDDRDGTVTLIEKCSGAVGFEAVATEHRWVVHISGGSVGRGDLSQTAKRSAISVRHSVALSRCRRGRKCAEMPLKADRNRCACRDDLKRFIARSRCRVG